MEQKQALARKWRPKNFSSMIGQQHVVQALSNSLSLNRVHHAYLFTGTRGVGKTTTARILAKCLNCETGITATPCDQCSNCKAIDSGCFPDLFEIDAASRTRVEDTKEILDNVHYLPTAGKYKIYLIDEVHMLSGHSFNALLKTLEEPPEHVKFLLATTDPQKLPATVLSRCLQFHLMHMQPEEIVDHLSYILTQESISFETPALHLIATAANGSMRDALSLLDQSIVYNSEGIFTEEIGKMLGTTDTKILEKLLIALAEQDAETLLQLSSHLQTQGTNYKRALSDLLLLLHKITIIQVCGNTATTTEANTLQSLAQQWAPEEVQLYYEIALLGQKNMELAPTMHIGFEMTLLRMLAFKPEKSVPTANPVKPTQRIAEKTKTIIPSATAKPSASKNTSSDAWVEMLTQIKLTGATNALAQACALEEFTGNQLKLIISPNHEALLNKRQIERIKEAINESINEDINVSIRVAATKQPTAQMTTDKNKKEHAKKLEDNLMNDKVVRNILKTFDGTIVKETINDKQETQ
jgi:DNA polymerase III subunit gamma/tau